MALNCMDKRIVAVLSTIYDGMTVKRRRTRQSHTGVEEIVKPAVIDAYNSYMGGVDKADQFLVYYSFHNRIIKWRKRAAFNFLNVALVNTYIVYTETSSPGRKLP